MQQTPLEPRKKKNPQKGETAKEAAAEQTAPQREDRDETEEEREKREASFYEPKEEG